MTREQAMKIAKTCDEKLKNAEENVNKILNKSFQKRNQAVVIIILKGNTRCINAGMNILIPAHFEKLG